MPALEFRDVSFTRPGGTRVLDHFDLAVDDGEVLALVGRSGAGKTTHPQARQPAAAAGLPATCSSKGRSTREWDPIRLRRRVGYVLQDVGLVSAHDRRRQRRRRAAARRLAERIAWPRASASCSI